MWALVPTHSSGAWGQGDCAPPLSAWQSRSGLEPQVRERSRPSLSGLAWHGQSTAYACVAALSLLAVPSNVREGEGPPPPPLGLARQGLRTTSACAAALPPSAVPFSEREGTGPLPAGSRPARAAHCLCACRGLVAVCYSH